MDRIHVEWAPAQYGSTQAAAVDHLVIFNRGGTMKRGTLIMAVAMIHAVVFTAGGSWPWVHLASYQDLLGLQGSGWVARGFGGMQFFIGCGLFISIHRGLVEPPVRLIAAGAGAFGAFTFFLTTPQTGSAPIALAIAATHILLALAWTGIMLTGGSPYRPRPVMDVKRQKARL